MSEILKNCLVSSEGIITEASCSCTGQLHTAQLLALRETMKQHAQALLAILPNYQPFDEIEAQHLSRVLEFLKTCETPFSRSHTEGHITGSAVITNDTHVLLIWHEKLQRRLQPGGHCEPEIEQTTYQTALRELMEETGLLASQVTLFHKTPFDIDVHEIPARGSEPPHWHYDIRYWFKTTAPMSQSRVLQWKTIEEVSRFSDISLSRLARKLGAFSV